MATDIGKLKWQSPTKGPVRVLASRTGHSDWDSLSRLPQRFCQTFPIVIYPPSTRQGLGYGKLKATRGRRIMATHSFKVTLGDSGMRYLENLIDHMPVGPNDELRLKGDA